VQCEVLSESGHIVQCELVYLIIFDLLDFFA